MEFTPKLRLSRARRDVRGGRRSGFNLVSDKVISFAEGASCSVRRAPAQYR